MPTSIFGRNIERPEVCSGYGRMTRFRMSIASKRHIFDRPYPVERRDLPEWIRLVLSYTYCVVHENGCRSGWVSNEHYSLPT
ncbi:hypothetical protein CY34DRAFT_370797 [Suillus luteus UH-Slu-Lm8-n1]|uniref:Uncharacterized protein n=1 Tax=Suillus luteus UH-Slu-Lm8-n1 TaxID=930992 RepID=A0A0D0AAG6_9AGAM|nr:hypothetical protein CY34DRAFT_370797 [Suillus luteus UH-Slu-Lm8-n1]